MAVAPKREELELYFERKKQIGELRRQASDLVKLQDPLEEKFSAYVLDKGGNERAVMRCGYRLALVEQAGTVSWVKEFLLVAGEDAAKELREAAPKKDVLVIEPPA